MSASPVAVRSHLPADWKYQTKNTVLLPYSERHVHIYPENFLCSVYYRLKEEGTLETIYPGMDVGHLNRFICYMGSPQRLGFVVPCLKSDGAPPKPVGIGWLCEAIKGRGSFGFGFFKEVWGKWEHADLSMQMLAWWFFESKMEVLYGTTLNRVAFNYSKRFGFKPVGTLPKFFSTTAGLEDGQLIVLEKERFIPYYNWWKARRG
ncbi:MAG TPA: hypothetical protein VNI35_00420 [Nitrospira sp.]|nr:hypothetical protein [Nitrospira sp.]